MNNKKKPIKAIDFQNKMEGKMEKHDEQLMNALNRITKEENALRDFKAYVERDKDGVNAELKNANLDIMFWQFMTGITTATVIMMTAYYVFG